MHEDQKLNIAGLGEVNLTGLDKVAFSQARRLAEGLRGADLQVERRYREQGVDGLKDLLIDLDNRELSGGEALGAMATSAIRTAAIRLLGLVALPENALNSEREKARDLLIELSREESSFTQTDVAQHAPISDLDIRARFAEMIFDPKSSRETRLCTALSICEVIAEPETRQFVLKALRNSYGPDDNFELAERTGRGFKMTLTLLNDAIGRRAHLIPEDDALRLEIERLTT